ncbi:MAG TPA: hypothetical protein VKT82_28875 [Ktedonobacterales bacterium]|nr:hypothetical protein [Ktedonobacterales bacterium]
MREFEPREDLPAVKNGGDAYPYHTVKVRRRRFLGPKYEVFGITHPYSATHATNGYYPTGEIYTAREEAQQAAKNYTEFMKQERREQRHDFLRRLFR